MKFCILPIPSYLSGSATRLTTLPLFRAFLLFFLVLSMLMPCAANAQKESATNAVISGKVIQAKGNTPVQGALVKATDTKGKTVSVMTGSDGTYQIKNLTDQKYELTVSLYQYIGKKQETVFTKSKQSAVVNFSLLKETVGDVYGKIIDYTNGLPITGASIAIYNHKDGPLHTDTDGRYSISDLTPGYHYLIARADGYVTNIQKFYIIIGAETGVNINLVRLAASQTVDSKGATLTAEDGTELIIPPEALSEPADISITVLPFDAYYLGVLDIDRQHPLNNLIKFFPDSLKFLKPVEVTVPILNPDTKLNGAVLTGQGFFNTSHFDPENLFQSKIEKIYVDKKGESLSFKLNKFPESVMLPPQPVCLPKGKKQPDHPPKTWVSGDTVENCNSKSLSISFGLSWYLSIGSSVTDTVTAQCCKKTALKAILPKYKQKFECYYPSVADLFFKPKKWTEFKTSYGNLSTKPEVKGNCSNGDAVGACCSKQDTQCKEYKCFNGAPKKYDKPLVQQCEIACKKCKDDEGCVDYKCKECENCVNGSCVDKCIDVVCNDPCLRNQECYCGTCEGDPVTSNEVPCP